MEFGLENSELEKELIKQWEHFQSLGYKKTLSWIKKRIRKYYSNFIKEKEVLNKLIKNSMKQITAILNYLEHRNNKEMANEFFNNILLTLLVFDIKKEIPGPLELSFLSTYQLLFEPMINTEKITYIS